MEKAILKINKVFESGFSTISNIIKVINEIYNNDLLNCVIK